MLVATPVSTMRHWRWCVRGGRRVGGSGQRQWPSPASSFRSRWPRSGPTQISHFYCDGRGVDRTSIFISIVIAAAGPNPDFSLLSRLPLQGSTQHSLFYCGSRRSGLTQDFEIVTAVTTFFSSSRQLLVDNLSFGGWHHSLLGPRCTGCPPVRVHQLV